MMFTSLLLLAASCGLAAEGGIPGPQPGAAPAQETLSGEVSRLTPAERDTARLIQRSHYGNFVDTLRGLKISGRDKKDPRKAVSCSLAVEVRGEYLPQPQESFVDGVPVLRLQPAVFAVSQQAISAGVIRCQDRMFFTSQSIQGLEAQFSALSLKNSGTAFCAADEDCQAFWVLPDSEEPEPAVASVLTDGVFSTGLRRFLPGLRAQLDGTASQALRVYGEKHPDFGKPWPRYPQAPPGPEPKAVCRQNLCRLAGF